jgi:hypothetical protein
VSEDGNIREHVREREQEKGSAWELPEDGKPLSDSQLWRYIARADRLSAADFLSHRGTGWTDWTCTRAAARCAPASRGPDHPLFPLITSLIGCILQGSRQLESSEIATVICSNCGADIPFTGNVCPHCKADKSKDQHQTALAMVFGFVGGMVGFGAGMAKGDVCFGAVAGLVGMVLGIIVGMVLAFTSQKEAAKRWKPRHRRPYDNPFVDPDTEPLAEARPPARVPRARIVAPPPIRYRCPHCQTTLESPAEDAGAIMLCPACGGQLQVPGSP